MIKRLSLISIFSMLPASFYYAQTTVFAYVKDDKGTPIENAEVMLQNGDEDILADKIGYFQLVDMKPGHYKITVMKPNFENKVLEFDVLANEKRKNLGTVTLYSNLGTQDLGLVLIDSSNDTDEIAAKPTLGLLHSSQDVFSNVASFDLGNYWFRPRGVDGRMSSYMINGINMANPDRGIVNYSDWGGLNDITKYPEIAENHAPSEYGFGGAGGVVSKYTNASSYRKGFQLTQSLTNRNYRYRTSLRYTSGMSRNGWVFTIMGARRWAQEGIQEGTFYDAYGTYLGIEKRFGNKHSITFNFIGSPYRRSTASPMTEEVKNYRGIHYNAYWGWQNGRKRSERIKEGFQPIFQISDFLKLGEKSNLVTTVSYQFGKDKSSRLDWYNAQNPSTLYYKNLPSYWFGREGATSEDLEEGEFLKNKWETNDPNYTQINWEALYNANRGREQSVYYLVNDVNDDKIWNAATHFTYNFGGDTSFYLNLAYQNYNSEQYREVRDLLGGDYALNQDPYASTNQPGKTGLLNETDNNIRKKVGDKIGYDYIFSRQEVNVNPSLKFRAGNFDVFVSGLFSYSSSSRDGKFKHYLYDNSYGKSKEKIFWNTGLKGQVVYRINGRNFLKYNGAFYSQAPYLTNLYPNARVNAVTPPNIQSTVINANDISYIMSTPFVKIRATAYLLNSYHGTDIQRFFADGVQLSNVDAQGNITNAQSAFVTQLMTDVEKRNTGAELGIQANILPTLVATGVVSYGEYTYRNNPAVYFMSDAAGIFPNGEAYINYGKSYIRNFKVGGTPQKAYSFGLKYNSPKFWWIGASWNYLDDNYLDPSSILRTDFFVTNPNTGTPYAGVDRAEYRRLTKQVKLKDGSFFNVNAGKSFLIGKYYLLITASVNNILDNTSYATGGFEQTRNVNFADFRRDHDRENPYFAPKYFYLQGRQYFVNLQLRF